MAARQHRARAGGEAGQATKRFYSEGSRELRAVVDRTKGGLRAVGARLGVWFTTVSRWASGERRPCSWSIDAMEEIYGIARSSWRLLAMRLPRKRPTVGARKGRPRARPKVEAARPSPKAKARPATQAAA